MKTTNQQIKETLTGLDELWISDRLLAKEMKAKHLRNGKISKVDSKEGAGVGVLGFGRDELDNVVALCRDGIVRQFI